MKDITQGALTRKCRMASPQNFVGFRLTTLNADQHARSGYGQYSAKGGFYGTDTSVTWSHQFASGWGTSLIGDYRWLDKMLRTVLWYSFTMMPL
ncbi:MipA/OmpV family protein [Pantoea allii]|uniref:MipA/OmpV family protein n=1 Tax=Pantoea allii TaxID=574096 RepID=UPI0030C769DC